MFHMRKKPKAAHPVTLLPFVKDRPSWKVGDRNYPRDFWAVEATGDYAADCAIGEAFAEQALDYINANDDDWFLGSIVFDMIVKGEKSHEADKGIIVGFMAEIARHAAYGRKILKAIEEAQPCATVAILTDPDGRPLLVKEEVYPEAGKEAA
jgi:hypothetical protein